MATANVLSAQSLSGLIARSLPPKTPQLKNAYDAVAVAVHAAMIAVGFRLIGLSEDDRLGADATSDSSHVRALPEQWNIQSPAHFGFRYAHSQSSMEYLVKMNRLGNKVVVMGMGIGDDKTTTFDIKIDDYISRSSLPASPSIDASSTFDASNESTSTDSANLPAPNLDAKKAIIAIYISQGRLSDLAAFTRLYLIQKLLPSLHKPGYEETFRASDTRPAPDSSRPSDPTTSREPPTAPQPARPSPLHEPLAMQPRRPMVPQGDFGPPGFEDEYDMTRPPRPLGGPLGGGFGNIGHRDLYPQGLGPNDPFRSMGPGLGGGGGGGMHPTFDDPMFQGQGQGGGYDPMAPPGSRYDPVGPGGAPRGSGGGGFPGPGRGLGGRPGNPFGGFGGGDFI